MGTVSLRLFSILFLLVVFSLVSSFSIPLKAKARSGCCSWHGGVCGCSCCDGSPLSATCAPYYPSCNSAPIPTYPTCPPNSMYDKSDGTCSCNNGYCTNTAKSACVKLPLNAHCVGGNVDSWLCDSGFVEVGNSCERIKSNPEPSKAGINNSKDTNNVDQVGLESNKPITVNISKNAEPIEEDKISVSGADAILALLGSSLVSGGIVLMFKNKKR